VPLNETQAILRDHPHVVFALASALKVRRSLDARDLDEVIASAVAIGNVSRNPPHGLAPVERSGEGKSEGKS
jgi:hypothetical protein